MAEQHYSRRATRRLAREVRQARHRRERDRQRKLEADCADLGHYWFPHDDLELCSWCGGERDRWNKRRTPSVRDRATRPIGGRR